jgi:uncharacterized Fe-S cluster-containing MiaB family protein
MEQVNLANISLKQLVQEIWKNGSYSTPVAIASATPAVNQFKPTVPLTTNIMPSLAMPSLTDMPAMPNVA